MGDNILWSDGDDDVSALREIVFHTAQCCSADRHLMGGLCKPTQLIHLANKIGNKQGSGCAIHLSGCADLFDTAMVYHHNSVGHGQRLFLIMGDHHGSDAQLLLQRLDFMAQMHPHFGVER